MKGICVETGRVIEGKTGMCCDEDREWVRNMCVVTGIESEGKTRVCHGK